MPLDQLPRAAPLAHSVCPALHVFPLDDAFAVFRPMLDRLHVLNSTAKEVLDAAQEGVAPAALAAEWARRHGISANEALAHVQVTCRELEHSGLIGDLPPARIRQPAAAEQARFACPPDAPPAADYRIGPRAFSVRCATPALSDLLAPYLGHLQVSDSQPQTGFEVLRAEGRLVLNRDSQQILATQSEEELILGVVAHTAETVRDDETHLVALHAAAVARSGTAIALMAASGAGKSTLTSYLAHHGYDYLSDDMLPIRLVDGMADAVPSCIGLKEGSWPVVTAFRPDLPDGRVLHAGSKSIRYLKPPRPAANLWSTPIAVSAMVFPRYRPDAAASLSRSGPAEALRHLVESQAYVPLPLTVERVSALIRWAASRPSYHLSYDDLETAERLLGKLVP